MAFRTKEATIIHAYCCGIYGENPDPRAGIGRARSRGRALAYYVFHALYYPRMSYLQIAQAFGKTCHSTVYNGVSDMQEAMAKNDPVKKEAENAIDYFRRMFDA